MHDFRLDEILPVSGFGGWLAKFIQALLAAFVVSLTFKQNKAGDCLSMKYRQSDIIVVVVMVIITFFS